MLVFSVMKKEADSSTELLVSEARRRGLKIHRLSPVNLNYVRIEHGDHQELIYYTATERMNFLTSRIFLNKHLSGALLHEADFPAPAEITTDDIDEINSFLKKYRKIVIKPVNSTWGQGVTPGISDSKDIVPAVELARSIKNDKSAPEVICQQHIDGTEYRILVIDEKALFVLKRLPAHVTGDGIHTVSQLLEIWNGRVRKERQIKLNKQTSHLLQEQDMTLESVPHKGDKVLLKYVANLHAGGVVYDANKEIGSSARKTAIAVAKHFKAPVVGIDCITNDISKSIGYITELNSTPDIANHHYPTEGEAHDPAGAIIDMLFPETKEAVV